MDTFENIFPWVCVDVVTGACVVTLTGHRDGVRSVVFSGDGHHEAGGHEDMRNTRIRILRLGHRLVRLIAPDGHHGNDSLKLVRAADFHS